MYNPLKRENLKKSAVITIVSLIILSNAIPLIFGDSDSDEWGNKLNDNISYTTSTGGYCKVTAQGGKVGIKFPYVDADILSVYLYKACRISYDYKYVKNGVTKNINIVWTGNTGKKVMTITLPVGTTSFSLTNCNAKFEFNSALLTTGLWTWTVPRYQYLGPISDYK